ncbi:MAG: DUF6061 family protein [Candidatus Faecousia sp.]|nr:DUF6061 family protein [Candidatus Faecousia sp.]
MFASPLNIDTASVELVFDDGSRISIDFTAVEQIQKISVTPLLSSLRKAQSAGPIRFDALCFLLSGEAGLTLPLRAPWAMQWHAAGTF